MPTLLFRFGPALEHARDAPPSSSSVFLLLAIAMSIISHVSIGTSAEKFPEMLVCYDALMAELGAKRIMMVSTDGSKVPVASADTANLAAVAYGKHFPEFWVTLPAEPTAAASAGNGTHIALQCSSNDMVRRVYDAAVGNGAADNGEPGLRAEYSAKYYGGFFVDPMGNKIEAVFLDLGLVMNSFVNNCAIA